MKNSVIAAAVGVAFLAYSGAALSADSYTNNEIKLGVLTDLSGPYASFQGKGAVEAAKMAIEDFKGSVNGVPVKLEVADHQNNPEHGTAVTRKWVEHDGVDAMFGVGNSALALSVADLAKKDKFIVVQTGSSTQNLETLHCSPYSIHYAWNSTSLATVPAKSLMDSGHKKWFFITVNFEFGQTLQKIASQYVEKSGGEVVGSVLHPFDETDYSSYVLQAKSSGADVIAIANAGSQLVNTLKAIRQFGLKSGQEVASLLTFITDIHALGLQEAQGLKYGTAFYWDRDAETRAWSEKFLKRVGAMPTMNHAAIYSGVYEYLKAVKESETDDSTVVAKRMHEVPINDIFAKNGKIRADGLMVHDWNLVQVKTPEQSHGEWDYLNVVDTVPGDKVYQPMSKECYLVE